MMLPACGNCNACAPRRAARPRSSVPVILDALPDIESAHPAIGGEVAEAAGVKRQWCARGTSQSLYLTEDDEMVAARVHRLHPAVEAAQYVGQVRRGRLGPPPGGGGGLFRRGPGEGARGG